MVGEIGIANRPVQQVEIEIISAQTSKACLASTRDICRAIHFGYKEHAVAPTSNRMTDQFLGTAAPVPL